MTYLHLGGQSLEEKFPNHSVGLTLTNIKQEAAEDLFYEWRHLRTGKTKLGEGGVISQFQLKIDDILELDNLSSNFFMSYVFNFIFYL